MDKSALLLTASFFVAVSSQQTFSQQKQEIAAECTTNGATLAGSAESCDSAVTITAPTNHVFAVSTLAGGMTSGAGSEKDCILNWHDYVEVIAGSGITQPRTVTLQAHARSPKHNHGARGWAHCTYHVGISKYK